MSLPLVSIIIPTYNRAYLINETLDSILLQTYVNWECIVVDDCSEDDTELILEKYICKDNRFQYYKRPKNRVKGAGSCRNYGLELSKGEFINWFDSDDIMLENFLMSRMELVLKFPKTNIAFCAFKCFNLNEVEPRVSNKLFNGNIIEEFINSQITFGPPSYLIKKNVLKGFLYDENLHRAEDADFFLRFYQSIKNLQIKHTPEVLFYVRKHQNTISSFNDKQGLRLNSQFIVHKRILIYLNKTRNKNGILKYKKRCIIDLKRLLENKNYNLVIKNIMNFKHITFLQKVYLLLCVCSQRVIGRGAYQFYKFKI